MTVRMLLAVGLLTLAAVGVIGTGAQQVVCARMNTMAGHEGERHHAVATSLSTL